MTQCKQSRRLPSWIGETAGARWRPRWAGSMPRVREGLGLDGNTQSGGQLCSLARGAVPRPIESRFPAGDHCSRGSPFQALLQRWLCLPAPPVFWGRAKSRPGCPWTTCCGAWGYPPEPTSGAEANSLPAAQGLAPARLSPCPPLSSHSLSQAALAKEMPISASPGPPLSRESGPAASGEFPSTCTPLGSLMLPASRIGSREPFPPQPAGCSSRGQTCGPTPGSHRIKVRSPAHTQDLCRVQSQLRGI